MQGHNPFAQFQTSGPMGQFPNANPDFRMSQGKPQQGQFNPQQFPNPQMMQFQTMQPQMFPNMMPNQMGPNNPGVPIQNIPQQQNIAPPQKPRLIVKLENNERGFYSTMLSQVDPTERGRVEGKDAATFFRRSGLPSEVLKKIWLIATSDNKTLDKEEFYVYMRLVAYAQNNIEVSPQSIIQNIKAPLPKLQSSVPPPQKKEPSGETTPKDSGANLLDMGPTTTTPNIQMNVQPNPQMNMQPNAQMSAQGFGNLNFNNPAMTNPQQANLMGNMPINMPMGFGAGGSTPGSMGNISNMPNMSSNMPSANLLGDTPNLMGAQDDLLEGDLPTTGSQTKIDVNPNPQIVSSGANISMNQSSPTNLKPENTLNVSNTAASEGALDESQGFSDVLVDLTPEYIKQYEDIYNQFDANKKGIVTQQEIGDVFLRSGLGNDVLFQIWSFCDTGDRGCLDKPEFMLSLHLIAMCKKKIRLPPTLPAKYEKFLKDAKKKLPAKDYLIEKARQALEESNPPPRLSHQGDEYQQRPSDYGETGYDNYEANHQPQYNEPSHARNDYGDYERDDVPLTQENYGHSNENNSSQVLRKLQEHQNELISTASQIKDSNNRLIADKKEDIRNLNMILQSCQEILQKLISENDYIQAEMVTLDNQKKNIQNSIESVQYQISQELVRQQGLHRNSKTRGSPHMNPNRMSMGSPQKPHDEQFGVDFQKEFAGGWDGFDDGFGDQNQNPNTANNFGEFNDF